MQRIADHGAVVPMGSIEGPASGAGGRSAVELTERERALTALDLLDDKTQAREPRSQSVGDIAAELHTRGRKALRALRIKGGKIEGPDPRTDELLSRAMAAEIEAAMRRNPAAANWYTERIEAAMRIAAAIHPELATDPNARTAFTAALAITSQGETVPSNVRLAEVAYAAFKKTGRFPTDVAGKNAAMMNGNFAKLNDLLDAWGLDGLRRFLNTEFTLRELEQASGYTISGENKDRKVYGSAILGPKIGQGFFQNLNGNYTPVTMDLWFMRAWGRLTGTLVGWPKTQEKQKAYFAKALENAGRSVPKTQAGLDRRSAAIVAEHERNFRKYRAEYAAGTRAKSELLRAAQRYIESRFGIKRIPASGAQRAWMRERVERARQILNAAGYPVTNADIQALWWYLEKHLYAKMGGWQSESLNTDYAAEMVRLARRKGLSDEEIGADVGALGLEPRSSGEAPDAEATQGHGARPHAPDEGEGAAEPARGLARARRGKIRLAPPDARIPTREEIVGSVLKVQQIRRRGERSWYAGD
jgi:hypothetical protein